MTKNWKQSGFDAQDLIGNFRQAKRTTSVGQEALSSSGAVYGNFVCRRIDEKRRQAAASKANIRRKYCLLFVRHDDSLLFVVFNRCSMRGDSNGVLSCLERERLEEELTEARSRGRNLTRLRNLTPFERAALEGREQTAQTRLKDHDAEHGCQR